MADIESLFPNLPSSGYRLTSPETPHYNCVAWAAGSSDQWWEAAPGYYWPLQSAIQPTIDNVVAVFLALGFSPCSDGNSETGYEKVAVYGIDGEYTHVARQLPSGKWTSKLGALEDIEHDTLEGLIGTEYGPVERLLRRKVP